MLERLFAELDMHPRMSFHVVCARSCPRGQGEMRVSVTEATATAEINLVVIGMETKEAVRAAVRQLCRKKNRVHLPARLPLRDPATPFLCDS
jgi:hypothetical protein